MTSQVGSCVPDKKLDEILEFHRISKLLLLTLAARPIANMLWLSYFCSHWPGQNQFTENINRRLTTHFSISFRHRQPQIRCLNKSPLRAICHRPI